MRERERDDRARVPVDVAIDAELSFFSQKELLGAGEAGEAAVAPSVPVRDRRVCWSNAQG